jgi:hypothetical protein
MQTTSVSTKSVGEIITLVFKGVGMAMPVAAVVLNILGTASLQTQVLLLGIGVACLGIVALDSEKSA